MHSGDSFDEGSDLLSCRFMSIDDEKTHHEKYDTVSAQLQCDSHANRFAISISLAVVIVRSLTAIQCETKRRNKQKRNTQRKSIFVFHVCCSLSIHFSFRLISLAFNLISHKLTPQHNGMQSTHTLPLEC